MQIKIDSYKNIKDLRITIPDSKLLILLGSNGVGKTNTLEAISLGLYNFDNDTRYDSTYLLSLDALTNHDVNYPHQKEIREIIGDSPDDFQNSLLNYLEKAHQEIQKPLLRQYINDALTSLSYSITNNKFDPSTLAITRLVILHRLYQTAQKENKKYIILVDSPELFAHPLLMDEITTILSQLREIGCLIILSTHSNYVISKMFTSFLEIVKLDKDPEGLVVAQCVDMEKIKKEIKLFYDSDENLKHSFSRSSHYDEGLLTLLDKDIEAYLITAFRDHIITAYFSKVVVLGEGASENVLFDYIENEIHPNWIREHQVGFITCMGKSTMPLYFIFLNQLGVKTFVLYDYDNQDNVVHKAYKEGFDNYYQSHKSLFGSYYLKPDLEGYLNIDFTKVQSIIKPVHIFNYTFLQKTENHALTELLDVIEDNIIRMVKTNEH